MSKQIVNKWKDIAKKYHPRSYEKIASRLDRTFYAVAKRFNTNAYRLSEYSEMYIGTVCIYCGEEITVDNISFDHTIPLHRGGMMDIDNCSIICRRCNTRKGTLTREEFRKILNCISLFQNEAKRYVLRKLAMKDYGSKR